MVVSVELINNYVVDLEKFVTVGIKTVLGKSIERNGSKPVMPHLKPGTYLEYY